MTEFADFIKDALPTLMTGLIAAVSGWMIARTNKKGAREIDLINELQEEVKRLHDRVNDQDSAVQTINAEKLRQAVYIALLKQHIIEKQPPPPPEYKD